MDKPTAIERLKDIATLKSSVLLSDSQEALGEGIAAIEFLHVHKDEIYFRYDLPRPGEFEDEPEPKFLVRISSLRVRLLAETYAHRN